MFETKDSGVGKGSTFPVKRETGERPVRTRHCMQLLQSLGGSSGHWKREGGFVSHAVSQETCHCPDMELPRVIGFRTNNKSVGFYFCAQNS
jgi:hypothetical protein